MPLCYTGNMTNDGLAADAFYDTPAGAVAAQIVRARLRLLWPAVTGQRVLGLGHTAPYLDAWRDDAYCCIAACPGEMGAAPRRAARGGVLLSRAWPGRGGVSEARAEEARS